MIFLQLQESIFETELFRVRKLFHSDHLPHILPFGVLQENIELHSFDWYHESL